MNINQATSESANVVTRLEAALYPEPEPISANKSKPAVKAQDTYVTVDNEEVDDEGVDKQVDDGEDDEVSLAKYLGVDESQLDVDEEGNIFFNAKVEGVVTKVPLVELAKSYQLQKYVNNKSMAVEDERKQIRAARQQELDQYNQQLATATQLTTFLEAQVVGEFNNVNWEALRIQDPAEYAARRQEFAERAQQVQQAKAYATSQQQRAWQIGQAETMQNHQQYLQQQAELMIQSNPTWQDQATLARDMGSMKEFMSHQYGFTEDDFQVVTDHRMIKVLQDAKAFRDGKEAAKPKLTKTVPKYVKPGQRQAVAGAVGMAVKQKRAALKRSGSIQDAASLLESRM